MAAGFQNWAANNRFLPFKSAAGKAIALPTSYTSSSYPKNAAGMAFYMEGDAWFRDEKAPGYANSPMPGGVTGNNTARSGSASKSRRIRGSRLAQFSSGTRPCSAVRR